MATTFAILIITVGVGLKASFYLYPLYTFLLFRYVNKATGTFNVPFLLMLLFAMIAEIFFLLDFEKYIYVVSISILVSLVSLLFMLREVINFKRRNFATHIIAEVLLGMLAIGLIVGYLAWIIIPRIAEQEVFIPAFIGVLFTSSMLYSVPLFNKHPANLLLTGVASALLVEMVFVFMYTFLLDLKLLLICALFFASFYKVVFAMYLVRLDSVKEISEDYI